MVHPRFSPSVEIRVWSVQDRREHKGYANRPWLVRWQVGAQKFARSHRTRSEADLFRSSLLVAKRDGVPFDMDSGEPEAWSPEAIEFNVFEWVLKWVGEQWDEWQPRTRTSAVEALSRLVPLAVQPEAKVPDGLRPYLKKRLRADFDSGELDEVLEAWMTKYSLPLFSLNRQVLAEVDHRLGLKLDGGMLAATTANRFRTVSKSCIRRAFDLGVLSSDPWPPPQRGAKRRKVRRKSMAVDVDVLPDPKRMAELLAAVESDQPASRQYRVMTSVVYYAGLRPSEVVMLRPKVLSLPESGWGTIRVMEADISFGQSGEPKTGRRKVPIPPVLVEILSSWIVENGLSGSDLLFRTRNGNRPSHSNWTRAWRRAQRSCGMEPPIRLYDCRHAAATTWLAAGVPLGETARRLGHSVEVLVSTYVGALSGDEVAANRLIEEKLGAFL